MHSSLHNEHHRIPLLLFSGGLDSSYNLWCRLDRTPVDILYADGGQAPLKIEAEKAARRKILDYLHGFERFKVRREIEAESINFVGMPGANGFTQVPAWLFSALYHVDPEIHSSVEISYVMGDDASMFRHEIIKAWEALCQLAKGTVVPLVFPTIHCRKASILRVVPSDLLNLVWVCEIPVKEKKQIKACGKCHACVRHNHELREFHGTTPQLLLTSSKKSKKTVKRAKRK